MNEVLRLEEGSCVAYLSTCDAYTKVSWMLIMWQLHLNGCINSMTGGVNAAPYVQSDCLCCRNKVFWMHIMSQLHLQLWITSQAWEDTSLFDVLVSTCVLMTAVQSSRNALCKLQYMKSVLTSVHAFLRAKLKWPSWQDTTHKLIKMHFLKLHISVKSVSYVTTQA